MDDVAAHVDAAILDGNIFRRIGIGDRQAVVVDRRIACMDGVTGNDRLVVASTDGDAVGDISRFTVQFFRRYRIGGPFKSF